MANLLRTVGKALGIYTNATSNEVVTDITTSYANKLWRAGILLHRATHAPSDDSKGKKIDDPARNNGILITKRKIRETKIKQTFHETIVNPDLSLEKPIEDAVVDLNRDSQVILYNTVSKPYEKIVLQNRPSTLDFKGETTWASIKSMGRNTPMYHYTGAEDTLQFNISWYCSDPDNPEEVINKCRFLEAWSKANGYKNAPPVIQIEWGNSGIYEGQFFILISATYTLRDFSTGARGFDKDSAFTDFREKGAEKSRGTVPINKHNMLPLAATQELIFKRVSATNLTWSDFLPESKMNKTKGINNN